MAKKIDDTELPIGRAARTVVVTLIGVHGLRRAAQIAAWIQEQMIAEVTSQARRHPDEWSEEDVRELTGYGQSRGGPESGVPPVPEIPAVPVI